MRNCQALMYMQPNFGTHMVHNTIMQVEISLKPNTPAVLFCSVAILFCMDLLWIGFIGKRVYARYNEWMNNMEIAPSKLMVVSAIAAYAIVASAVSSTIHAQTPGLAFGLGCLIGLWVFSAYNITTYAVTSGEYPGVSVAGDMIYGILTCGFLFFVQHHLANVV